MSRRVRAMRYGASIAVALIGAACGALIPGTAGGTAATVLVGIGLVGLVSLIFYEIGLSEDRDRARETRRPEPSASQGDQTPPGLAGTGRSHHPGRSRAPDRRRGQRRRLR